MSVVLPLGSSAKVGTTNTRMNENFMDGRIVLHALFTYI